MSCGFDPDQDSVLSAMMQKDYQQTSKFTGSKENATVILILKIFFIQKMLSA